jgi:thymidine kinase
MAKLYFYYSSTNASKSAALLCSSYNYRERGMNTLIMAPLIDDRYGVRKVGSRIGLEAGARSFFTEHNLLEIAAKANRSKALLCVLINEAQFLTRQQAYELGEVTDTLGIPVLAYWLRTNFLGEPSEGSKYLLS